MNLGVGYLMGTHQLLMIEFLLTFLYVFSKREPNNIVNFWGFQIKLRNFIWVLMVLSLIMGQDIMKSVVGYLVGHLYVFLKFYLPETPEYRKNLLETPRWFVKLVNWINFKITGRDNRPRPQMNNVRNVNNEPAAPAEGSSNYSAFRGRGMRLGGD
uniref:Derlin n=1 Tax=Euplotes harpa TaxID=151035 RepID=A0A7S3JMZ5_9SPIT|mmetsp:Transcript_6070/g.7030  ORF Transcript_6070/g.7030 Transcript_6070/m.7030 type:complete len:156 (+) Transcript_6070:306-773(+)